MTVAHTPLGDLELVAGDLFERWDADMRSGKLLTALSGHMAPGYDPRVDRVRLALLAFPDLLEALQGLTGIIQKAGLQQLSRGVELGQISWAVKASDRMEAAHAAIARATGDTPA